MSYADLLSREAAWFRSDLATVGIPPLLAGIGDKSGPFDAVGAYPRRAGQRSHQLYLFRQRAVETRADFGGHRRIEHIVVAVIAWAMHQSANRAHLDEAALDAAVDRVLARVRGVPGDHTHGGRFFEAGEGEITVEYPDARTVLAAADAPWSAGQAFVVTVAYPIVEFVLG